jgi:hypothetical protein
MVDDKSVHDLFDAESLKRLNEGSYIKTKTENSLSMHTQIMSDITIKGTSSFQREIERILYVTGNSDSLDTDLYNTVANAIMGYIRSKFFFDETIGYCKKHEINPKSLVSGNNTMRERLIKLKQQLQYSPNYADLRDSNGEIKNYLLKVLIPGYQFNYDTNKNSK